MKKFFLEFKQFALRGNVIDLAVGVIIGASFQSIVKSLTDDIISPILGIFAKTDFSELSLKIGDVQLKYGSFITSVINFLIMAFVIFLLVKIINKFTNFINNTDETKKEDENQHKKCPFCCTEIAVEATKCPNCTSEL